VRIESAQLLLRALTPEDAAAIVAGERAGHSWADDFPTPGDLRTSQGALDGVMSFATEEMPWGLFTVIDKESGHCIGGIGFKGSPNQFGEVEIGYGVCNSFQRRGVATESVIAICDFASRGARVVIAETDRDNVASQRVLEKSGFKCDGEIDDLILWRKELGTPWIER
jgi:RimJ/RimL family protein N-acetyltransferase